MRLYVLGWQGPWPGEGGALSGYLLEASSGEGLLLDLGSGSLSRLTRIREPKSLCGIVLSHLHWDHISDMFPLSYMPGLADLPVLAQEEPFFARKALESGPWRLLPHEDRVLGPFRLRFFAARHPVPASCVRVECEGRVFVYTGDTNTVPGLAEFCRGADLLLADAGLVESVYAPEKPHLSPRLCAELAREAGVKRLVLTHLSPAVPPEDVLAEAGAFPGAVCAGEGLRVDF